MPLADGVFIFLLFFSFEIYITLMLICFFIGLSPSPLAMPLFFNASLHLG